MQRRQQQEKRSRARAGAIAWVAVVVVGLGGSVRHAECEEPPPPVTENQIPTNIGNPTGFNSVVGSGARAWGMGGAFIATADDGTAASWNPAGLAQGERATITASWVPYERSLFVFPARGYIGLPPPETGEFDIYSLSGNTGKTRANRPDYLSFSYPFVARNWRWVVQAGYQRAVNLDYSGDSVSGQTLFLRDENDTDGDGSVDDWFTQGQSQDSRYEGSGGYDVYSVSIAAGSEKFAAGISVNYWDASYRLETTYNGTLFLEFASTIEPGFELLANYRGSDVAEYDLDGWNVNAGVLYKPSRQWALGFVLKTAFTLEGTYEFRTSPFFLTPGEVQRGDAKAEWPMTVGIGVAYKPIESLRIEFDATQSNWSDSEIELNGSQTLGFPTFTDHQQNARQFRLGTEYVLPAGSKAQVPIRAGVFADQGLRTTIDGDTVTSLGFAFGTGVKVGGLFVDVAYVQSGANYQGFEYEDEQENREDKVARVFLTAVYRFSKLGE